MRGAVLITGVSAAGKSTVAQALAERLPRSAHVRGDTFRRMVVGGRAEMTPELTDESVLQLHLRYRIAAKTADLYFDAGFTPIVQDVILGGDLELFTKLIRTRPLHVIVLAPDPAEVARREAARPKTGYAGGWTIAQLDAALREQTPRLGLWLDTSRQSVEETVDEIISRAGEAQIA
ncbi:AAA family ATPase [Nonomuraea gerenzanensis]|uniref:Phosphotransferase (Aminonucleoside antibiotic resistance) n=1 Tax=Nonomuraea gerenzanensis TaxID=93944 RepID=A0A1M4DY19_9ACTN|nr:AAA family ATPase [Nonomuraea gerenzanensis]UBU13742.1 AAA family ATPase [Nonomuraea gerenzanensis]SBO91410.1 phosphotransferase (aminonucleoside antibiotic resistance) [Nonomuraea gerenzanensis]